MTTTIHITIIYLAICTVTGFIYIPLKLGAMFADWTLAIDELLEQRKERKDKQM